MYVVKRRRIEAASAVIVASMTNAEIQRRTMIETQLRPSSVNDPRVLAAVATIPRERFVPASLRPFAYIDEALEVWPSRDGAPARYLLSPLAQARLIQLAAVGPNDRVLDVACATGYSTALLAKLGSEVIGLEPEPELAAAATATLRELATSNARIVKAPLAKGHAAGAPYDAIVIDGSVPSVPDSLFDQLGEGGRLAAIIANTVQPRAWLYVKAGGAVSGMPHFDVGAKPLPGFAPMPQFAF
jgi:protein-L-isoaspartate(D-aspartate) O-methyltransferase